MAAGSSIGFIFWMKADSIDFP
jgi:alkanesulfonate monooxygenase SsuD/methylene tetrahydromethanopterin reductase-like flavin-dependent oxidoreductase (luciferase family)